jgi:Protein of unknown function (DUF1569)
MVTFAEVSRALDELEQTRPERVGGLPLAQALEHCAQSIEFSLRGYPSLRSGLFRATIGRIAKRKFLAQGRMRHDTTRAVPGAPPLGASDLPSALARLRAAIEAFTAHHGPLAEHLAYGPCNKTEYEALHAMHVADHLSEEPRA